MGPWPLYSPLAPSPSHSFTVQAAPQQTTITVPVYAVIVQDKKGLVAKGVTDAILRKQMEVLNQGFAVGAAAAGVSWQFKLLDTKRVSGPNMCAVADEMAMMAKHRVGGKNTLNVFFTDLEPCEILSNSNWPWDVDKKEGRNDGRRVGLAVDGVMLHYGTVPGGNRAFYNEGKTLIQATGKWMGLYNVFQNGCNGVGDMVDDTPAQRNGTAGCPPAGSQDTCPGLPGKDPVDNFMNSSDDVCLKTFTAGQQRRMQQMWVRYRA